MEELLLRVETAAKACNMGRSKFYEMIQRGEVPAIRLGGCLRVPADALRKWVDAQVEAQAPQEASR